MANYPFELLKLVSYLRKLPGVGAKTAERFAFQLLEWDSQLLVQFGNLLSNIKNKIHFCETCGCLREEECLFCSSQRNSTQICVISSAKDVYSIEETKAFQGFYHVTHGLLSPLEGKTAEHLHLEKLKKRIQDHEIKEAILALDSTIEGDTTALYLKQELSKLGLSVTRLALGLPMGSTIHFVDGGTLARAFIGRQRF
jgi:recombination protein RecR